MADEQKAAELQRALKNMEKIKQNLTEEMAIVRVLVRHIEADVREGDKVHLKAALHVCNAIQLITGTYL